MFITTTKPSIPPSLLISNPFVPYRISEFHPGINHFFLKPAAHHFTYKKQQISN
jgi:hypothetical protein